MDEKEVGWTEKFINTEIVVILMTEFLYLDDPCLSSFKATVTSAKGEWVMLDRTAFYPGGGGQEADLGTIDGFPVTDVRKEGDIGHKVPGHVFEEGREVECELDWPRRLDLMRGHTAEHMLFSAISNRLEDAELVKISITPDKKSVIVKGNLNWNVIEAVQDEVNRIISQDVGVRTTWVDRSDPALEGIRAKLDRIPGDSVRIVSIGDYDIAACAGVHVPSTGMIGSVLITGVTSARPFGSLELEFEVGERAVERGLELAGIALKVSEQMGSHPEDLEKAVENLRKEAERNQEALKRYGKQVLASLRPEEISGMRVYSGIYPGMDKKTILAAANQMVSEERTVCILMGVDESMMMVVARSSDLKLDCTEVLREALEPIDGRGGGKPEFATGGSSRTGKLESVLEKAIGNLR